MGSRAALTREGGSQEIIAESVFAFHHRNTVCVHAGMFLLRGRAFDVTHSGLWTRIFHDERGANRGPVITWTILGRRHEGKEGPEAIEQG